MFIAAPSVWDGFPVSDTVPFISDISDKHYQSISPKIAAERENTASLRNKVSWSRYDGQWSGHVETPKNVEDFQTRVSTTGKYVPVMVDTYLASQPWR